MRDKIAEEICYGESEKKPLELKGVKAKTILDLGGAKGGFSGQIKEKDTKVISIDIDISSLKQCKNVDPVLGNILYLPFKNDSFDIVVARAIFHHVPGELDVSLTEVKRILKNNGLLLVEEPCYLNPPAYLARKMLPSLIHAPNEKPFIPKFLKNKISEYFALKEIEYYGIFSYPMPYLIPKLSPVGKPLARKMSTLLYTIDKMLLTSDFFKNFCGYIYILAEKI
jgi:SAM-dependent methyltransferase